MLIIKEGMKRRSLLYKVCTRLSYAIHAIYELVNASNSWELAWRSGSVMDCHATARGSITGGSGVKLSFTIFARDSKKG